jgi:hypothetical protein
MDNNDIALFKKIYINQIKKIKILIELDEIEKALENITEKEWEIYARNYNDIKKHFD